MEKKLSHEACYICRQKGTSVPFCGKHTKHTEKGIYNCIACDQTLFESNAKFASPFAQPSFYRSITPQSFTYTTDAALNAAPKEVLCSRDHSHLGHAFEGAPSFYGQMMLYQFALLTF